MDMKGCELVRRYKEEGIQLDQIVIDFFHWPVQGDWKFDKLPFSG